MKKWWLFLLILALLPLQAFAEEQRSLKLSTTTSVQDSGLLDFLLPSFEKSTDIKVKVIAVGSGAALKLGENGDVDAVLAHAPNLEEEFVKKGFGILRHTFMQNDFIIVGPPSDPGEIKGFKKASEAFKNIYEKAVPFASRGDNSGTHQKEMKLWSQAGLDPKGKTWYMETGQGMGACLLVANERKGYTLVDRPTFLYNKEKLELVPLVEGDPELQNIYAIMAVNPDVHPHVHIEEAKALIDWITSEKGLALIASYQIGGQQAFFPLRGKPLSFKETKRFPPSTPLSRKKPFFSIAGMPAMLTEFGGVGGTCAPQQGVWGTESPKKE